MSARSSSDRYCSVRAMVVDDLTEVMQIERASYEFPWSEGIFKDCLRVGYRCLVVLEQDKIVGYGVLLLGADEAHVLNICLQSQARGNGFSRALLEKLIEIAIQAKAREIFLEVRPSNEVAVSLYVSAGFNEVGRRPNYYDAGSGREDALIYVKSI